MDFPDARAQAAAILATEAQRLAAFAPDAHRSYSPKIETDDMRQTCRMFFF